MNKQQATEEQSAEKTTAMDTAPDPNKGIFARRSPDDPDRRKARADGLWSLPEFDRRKEAGRRAIDRMAATPAEIDRFARTELSPDEYFDEDFQRD